MAKVRYEDCLRQAEENLKWGMDTLEHNYYPQACEAINLSRLVLAKIKILIRTEHP